MKKAVLSLCAAAVMLVVLAACSGDSQRIEKNEKVEPQGMAYFNYFDTVSYVYCYANDSAEQFQSCSADVAVILEEYHQLFDIYHEYSGMNNLCTVNKNAGGEPVTVDGKLIEFLVYAKELYERTDGQMNVMLGAVLALWHDCREQAAENPEQAHLPEDAALQEAMKHCGMELLEIDEEKSTVRILDPKASIDVGALGKGYAIERAAQWLQQEKKDGYVLNVGGNIRIIGTKPDGSKWVTGIRNPQDPGTVVLSVQIADTACVTSGSYERFFSVDGRQYHHIIDPDTLYPSDYFSSITVITPDSAVADCLSTALFCMSWEEGMALLERFEDVQVLWIGPEGEQYTTPGFEKLIVQP